MADPLQALGKAKGISQGTSQAGDALQAVIEALVGAAGLGGIPTPGTSGVDSNASRFGELLSAAAPLAGVKKGIRAFHGSPHDFDKFSLEKIGTGEGAQAYGHGLYFAGGEDTARYYRDTLQSAKRHAEPVVYAGKEYPRGSMYHQTLIGVAESGKQQIIDELERSIRFNASYAPDQANLQRSMLDFVRGIDESQLSVPKGRMYEVNINADPETLLDWDAPLSQQSPQVREALRREWLAHPEAHANQTGAQIYRNAPDVLADRGDAPRMSERSVGEDATAAMRKAGIPGIKYLDQGSRGGNKDRWLVTSPSGMVRDFPTEDAARRALQQIGGTITPPSVTRNYVMFDDSLIDIIRKYGWMLPAAGAMGYEATKPLDLRGMTQEQ